MEEEMTQQQPGEKLRLAREARELSVADVAANLKLTPEKISALEEGNIDAFAAPVFVAGYLRAYARLLELSETEVLSDFERLMPAEEPAADPELNEKEKTYAKVAGQPSSQFSLRDASSSHHMLVVGLAVVVGLVFFLWPASEKPPRHVVEKMPPAVEVGQSPEPEMDTSVEKGLDVIAKPEAEDLPVVDVQETDAPQSVEAESAAAPVATFDALAMGMKSELTLVFTEDSWVEVTDARDQRLVYRLGKAGSTRAVTGVAPFVVQLGYVPGVSIFYNGEEYDLSKYANRRSVRLRIGEAGDRMGGG